MAACCIKECETAAVASDMCPKHYGRMKRYGSPLRFRRIWGATAEERFWSYVHKTPTCWLWTGGKSHGYGNFGIARPNGSRKQVQAHRFAYELLVGPIPEGQVLDHLAERCGNKACVKVISDERGPAHLEPVPHRINVQRAYADYVPAATCRHGHAYTAENTHFDPRGNRICRTCRRATEARFRQRLREAGRKQRRPTPGSARTGTFRG